MPSRGLLDAVALQRERDATVAVFEDALGVTESARRFTGVDMLHQQYEAARRLQAPRTTDLNAAVTLLGSPGAYDLLRYDADILRSLAGCNIGGLARSVRVVM